MLMAVSCHDPETYTEPVDVTFTYGGYFLNAGLADENNAEITQLNTIQGIVNQRVFSMANEGKTLGDLGTDIHILGNKIYVSLEGSKQIRVIDKFNCQDLGTVTIRSEIDGSSLTPVGLASFEEALIVSLKEGYVARVDTTSLEQQLLQQVGDSPRQIAVANQKLYVTNTRDGEEPGHVVQMLNPVDLHIMKDIEVAANPGEMAVDPSDNNLYLVSAGNGSDQPARLQLIDTDSDEVSTLTGIDNPVLLAVGKEHNLIVYAADESDDRGGCLYLYNTESKHFSGEFISDGSYVLKPSMIAIDQNTGNVYVGDNADHYFGTIFIYTSFGQYVTSFNTGAPNPCRGVFVTSE